MILLFAPLEHVTSLPGWGLSFSTDPILTFWQ